MGMVTKRLGGIAKGFAIVGGLVLTGIYQARWPSGAQEAGSRRAGAFTRVEAPLTGAALLLCRLCRASRMGSCCLRGRCSRCYSCCSGEPPIRIVVPQRIRHDPQTRLGELGTLAAVSGDDSPFVSACSTWMHSSYPWRPKEVKKGGAKEAKKDL